MRWGPINRETDSYSANRRELLRATAISAGFTVAGCVHTGDDADNSEIIISSKSFPEQENLGYVAYELLRHNTEYDVFDNTAIGSNEDISNAYQAGEIHVYYDYLGSLWTDHPPRNSPVGMEPATFHEEVRSEMEATHPIRILDRTDWENTWAPFAKSEWIENTGIETLSDIAAHVNDGNYDVVLAFEDDFVGREDGLDNLLDHYKFDADNLEAWREREGLKRVVSPAAVGNAVENGDAAIGIGYETSAWLGTLEGIGFLDDNKQFWPPYNPVGIVHEDVADPPVLEEINKLPDVIPDAATMQTLNLEVAVEGRTPQNVIHEHLIAEGFIE